MGARMQNRRRVWSYGTASRDRSCLGCGGRMGTDSQCSREHGVTRGVCDRCGPVPHGHRAAAMMRVAGEYRAGGKHVLRAMQVRDWLAMAGEARALMHAEGRGVP